MQIVELLYNSVGKSLLKDNKWLHGETAIEILSVCDIKNNWTNRDKGQIGFETDSFFFPYSVKEKQMNALVEPIYTPLSDFTAWICLTHGSVYLKLLEMSP